MSSAAADLHPGVMSAAAAEKRRKITVRNQSINQSTNQPVSTGPAATSIDFLSLHVFDHNHLDATRCSHTHTQDCVVAVFLLFLPIQLPWSSAAKPVMHLAFALQTKEPTLFSHTEPAAQLWLREAHSSMSTERAKMDTMNG